MVSVIIPAFDEEKTIATVVAVARTHPQVVEVIVVDDGSTDDTAARAEAAGARVVSLKKNEGKAQAMEAGVESATSDIVLFLDADLIGLTHEHINRIIGPVMDGSRDMHVGIHARHSFWLNKLLRVFPIIGGERAVRVSLWQSVPAGYKKRFQIEIALNYFSKQAGRGMSFEIIRGLERVIKEKKYGVLRGFIARLWMIGDIVAISVNLYIFKEIRKPFDILTAWIAS
ncbi:MAG: hypothetical protein QG633_50 [Patescibacteria group bacterium]|jgi:glycosyltransferase involved in cell wall biosynthesis|nr:hypothetical protein [Patescibacteria group bacterium]